MYIGNPPNDGYGIAGYIFSTGDALIEDTITLSAPATVVLTGRLSGVLSATNSHYEEQGNDPEGVVLAQVQFLGERTWNGEGVRPSRARRGRRAVRELDGGSRGGGRDVHHPDRPAGGATAFPCPPLRQGRLPDLGQTNDLVSKTAMLDFANSLRFRIEVPEGITATSGSGFLPLTGGSPEEETSVDTTPPTLTTADLTGRGDRSGRGTCDLLRAGDRRRRSGAGRRLPTGLGHDVHAGDDDGELYGDRCGRQHGQRGRRARRRLDRPRSCRCSGLHRRRVRPEGVSANYMATAADAVDPAPVVVCRRPPAPCRRRGRPPSSAPRPTPRALLGQAASS